jgi:ribosomal protein S18 acetylase RimI-like enzyme
VSGLRAATLADLDALLALEEACFPPHQAYSRAEYRYALAQGRSVNLVEDAPDGRAVGFVGAFHHRAWRVGHVYTLNVHPEARRRGLGRRLMDACEARLADAGMRRVALEVNVANHAAIALYEALGYARTARLPGYYPTYEERDGWQYVKEL